MIEVAGMRGGPAPYVARDSTVARVVCVQAPGISFYFLKRLDQRKYTCSWHLDRDD